MISSQEFQQKLQAGQIQEALDLVGCDPTLLQRGLNHKLDVTTRFRPDSPTAEYLRTKIDLLTGVIQTEIGGAVAIAETDDRPCQGDRYHQLKQLHIEQVLGSYQIVADRLDRIQSILTALLSITSPSQDFQPFIATRPSADTLLAQRLTQSLAMSTATPDNLARHSEKEREPNEDELLLVDEDNEIWEEWVEDNDIIAKSESAQPTIVPAESNLPNWQQNWVHRPSTSAIDIKPIIPRSHGKPPASVISIPVDPAEAWDKFGPEHIGIDVNPQPPQIRNRDTQKIDRILAAIDFTSNQQTKKPEDRN